MKCNNTHCKYYEPAKQSSDLEILLFGVSYGKESGCKYPYCKKNKKNGRRRK